MYETVPDCVPFNSIIIYVWKKFLIEFPLNPKITCNYNLKITELLVLSTVPFHLFIKYFVNRYVYKKVFLTRQQIVKNKRDECNKTRLPFSLALRMSKSNKSKWKKGVSDRRIMCNISLTWLVIKKKRIRGLTKNNKPPDPTSRGHISIWTPIIFTSLKRVSQGTFVPVDFQFRQTAFNRNVCWFFYTETNEKINFCKSLAKTNLVKNKKVVHIRNNSL